MLVRIPLVLAPLSVTEPKLTFRAITEGLRSLSAKLLSAGMPGLVPSDTSGAHSAERSPGSTHPLVKSRSIHGGFDLRGKRARFARELFV